MPQLPLVLAILSIFFLIVFQTYQSIRDRSNLNELLRAQEPTVQEGVRVRQQLEALATKTSKLAADGDTGAREVIDLMQRQGIKLAPQK